MSAKFKISQKAKEELEQELKYRKGELRTRILDDLKEARSRGDLKENAEYESAKNEQTNNESRILEIEYILENCAVVAPSDGGDTAELMSTVKVVNLSDKGGNEMTFTLVSEIESDFSKGKISVESPLGAGLLGKKKGEIAIIELPNGKKVEYKILEVK